MSLQLEDSARSDRRASHRAQTSMGVLLLLGGAALIALAAGWIPAAPEKFNAPRWVIGAAGAMFIVAGVLMLIPAERRPALSAFLGATMASLFALVGGWVAFGPGPRRFGGALASGGVVLKAEVGEYFGSGVFGVGAVILSALAA